MNASELKIGDWVLFQGEKGTVYSIDPPSIFVKINDNIWGTTQSSINLTPIPLTEDIVKKNDWEKDEEKGYYINNTPWNALYLTFYRVNEKKEILTVWIESGLMIAGLRDIKYVHELQHILWILGIDDNIKL